MAENRDGKVCAVLRQSFIQAEREATQKEIDEELERIGFLYFIDTIIFETGSQGYEIYSSLSPRAQSH